MRIGEAKNPEELLAALEEARLRRLNKRRGFETIWWNNLALLAGDHYSEWHPIKGEIIQRMPTESRVRMVINHALAVARTELAKLSKSRPIMTVMANSNESIDIAATKVATMALDSLEWKFGLPKVRKNALWWMIACGVSGLYVGWNPDDRKDGDMEFILDPATGEPVFNQSRIADLQDRVEKGELDALPKEAWPLGDLEYKLYSAFQMLPDETATDFREIKDLITTDVVDIDEAKSIWGKPVDKLSPQNTTMGTIEKRLVARLSLNPLAAATNDVDNAINAHTFWLLPGRYAHNNFLKNGVMMRWSQNEELEFHKEFPFDDGRIPFAFFQHIPTNVSIWPDSMLQHIRDANLEVDKIFSQMIEAKDHMANPMWRIATQHQIVGKIKNEPGGQIRYVHVRDIPPPEPIPGIGLPNQVEELMMMLRGSILEISGQSEPTRGRMPSGVRSGVQIAYMQEEDDSKIGPTVEDMEWAVATMSSLSLSRIAQFYTVERTLRVYRKSGVFDVRKFRNANLRGTTDVVPLPGSGMPKSKAARQQYMLELAQLGVISDPRQLMEGLEVGQGEPTELEKDYAQAERENQVMLYGLQGNEFSAKYAQLPQAPVQQPQAILPEEGNGQVVQPDLPDQQATQPTAVPVKRWHNHQVHLERHFSIMKDEEFERMQLTNPAVVRLFDEHVGMHQQILAEMEQAKMQALEAAKGAPDGPPGSPSQPGGTSRRHLANMDMPDVIGGGRLDLATQTMRQE